MSPLDDMPVGSSRWLTFDAGGVPVDVFAARGANSRPLAVIVAGIHGDEYEGPAAAGRLASDLMDLPLTGSVLVIPVANPPAFAAGTRLSPADGKNLARCFPGDPAGLPTERLAHALFELVKGADYLIDLHSGGVDAEFVPLMGFYGEPGADNPSYRAARAFGLDTLWQLPPTPGVLSHEVWKRGGVAIGGEYKGGGRLNPAGRDAYHLGSIHCLAEWGLIPKPFRGTAPCQIITGDWLLAEAGGLFETHVLLGMSVPAGERLASIESPRGEVLQRLTAPAAGVVLARRVRGAVRPGEWAVLVGTPSEAV